MSEIGKKGGSVKSEQKSSAVRENGKKGGRPRKTKEAIKTRREKKMGKTTIERVLDERETEYFMQRASNEYHAKNMVEALNLRGADSYHRGDMVYFRGCDNSVMVNVYNITVGKDL